MKFNRPVIGNDPLSWQPPIWYREDFRIALMSRYGGHLDKRRTASVRRLVKPLDENNGLNDHDSRDTQWHREKVDTYLLASVALIRIDDRG
jgi:hypothetical protein